MCRTRVEGEGGSQMAIKVDQLSKEIMARLDTYTADIVEGMNTAGEGTATH